MIQQDIAMKRTKEKIYDLKRDENFAQTSMDSRRRKRQNRIAAVLIVAAGVGLLVWGISEFLRAFSGGVPGWLAPVLAGWVGLRFVRRILAALFSALFWMIVIYALCGLS